MAAKKKAVAKKRRRRSKNIYGTGDKGKATRLHSKIVRLKGACEICGADDVKRLQAAHIISRQYDATRVELDNALCLCAGCHLKQSHFSPVEVALCAIDKIGLERYNELKEQALARKAPDWAEELDRLTKIYEGLVE